MTEKIIYKTFINELVKKQFIILGEVHGTREIPLEIKKIIDSLVDYDLKNVFFEIPIEQQSYLDNFMKDSKESDLFNIPFFKNYPKDGRNSKEYLNLIKHIRSKKKVKIFFVDSLKNIKKRDLNVCYNIKNIYSRNKGLSVFVTGNLHAYKGIYIIKNTKFLTTGYYLKKLFKNKLISVNFIPMRGTFYNLGLKEIQKKDKLSKIVIKRESIGYDFNYLIPKVSPCSFIQ